MTGRGGTTLLVGVVPMPEMVPILAADITLQEKTIAGSYMGSNRFRTDMPRYIEFYKQGRLKLDELVTQELPLSEINRAFADMKAGSVRRSVITDFEN